MEMGVDPPLIAENDEIVVRLQIDNQEKSKSPLEKELSSLKLGVTKRRKL
jgi:hypothetical protein